MSDQRLHHEPPFVVAADGRHYSSREPRFNLPGALRWKAVVLCARAPDGEPGGAFRAPRAAPFAPPRGALELGRKTP